MSVMITMVGSLNLDWERNEAYWRRFLMRFLLAAAMVTEASDEVRCWCRRLWKRAARREE